MDSNGQPISDKCIIETITGKRVVIISFDSINEYVTRAILINALLIIDAMTCFCKMWLKFIQTQLIFQTKKLSVNKKLLFKVSYPFV